MIDEDFANRQNKLFAHYYWSRLVSWPLAGLTIFLAGLNSLELGPVLMWSGVLILLITAVYRYFLKYIMQSYFWDEYARILDGNKVDIWKSFHAVQAGPVVTDGTYSVALKRAVSGNYKSYPTVLQDVEVTYQKDTPGRDDATFRQHYMIHAIELPIRLPHLFVASKPHSKKRLLNPGNLWSLTTKLDPAQKLQDLEGDFGKYFEVYTTHTETDDLVFKKEADALRVLTPDVMLALRDDGFDFDYEIHENHLYVMHEPNLLTAAELENFILSLDAALSELIPQLTDHNFTDDGRQLTIRKAALTMDILFGPLVKPAMWALVWLAIVFLSAIIMNIEASHY